VIYPEITFKDFATVAKKRGHTAESLADRFRGKIENASEFFERAMTWGMGMKPHRRARNHSQSFCEKCAKS